MLPATNVRVTSTMDAASYLQPETLAQLAGLELKARAIVEGYVAGMHRSSQRGFSVEFAEHREYTPGDDLRYVDWKVYGKRDRHYLKQFVEEMNLVCELLLDVSGSMRYRSEQSPFSKLEYAKCIAAALAYLVLRQQDAVGLATFGSQVEQTLRPSSRPAQLKQLIQTLEPAGEVSPSGPDVRPADEQSAVPELDVPLHEVARRLSRRSLVVLLSDCFCDLERLRTALKHFRHRGHDVVLMHVIDPAEEEFPFQSPTEFLDLESGGAEQVDARSLRAAYRAEFREFQSSLQALCGRVEVDYLLLRTDRSLGPALSAYLARRARRVGSPGNRAM